ncbi:MAG TPA: phosphatase [Gammaproteobacteria bacterium]|jgi:3-deoxy-D-manno-octulosonate 8-phosphate phosphatase (KDO 8-P phosphatase)|nr:phosphatase [Gammaproteobacteria bacterium]
MKPEAELAVFSRLGGTFVTPIGTLIERMRTIRGFVSDWDGVFNQGAKGEGAESTYSEPDSMGINLLRYALWRQHGELPIAALITGAENPSARSFALREHFHAVYFGSRNKTVAIEALCRTQRVSSDRLICVFDDVNDLGMAFACGIRVFVQRSASPLLREYVVRQGLCDYVTAHSAERHAVREVCELLLGLLGSFEAVVASRVAWDTSYAEYFAKRQALATEFIDQRVND